MGRILVYISPRGKSDPPGEVMPMEQFLLDIFCQVVAGVLVVLISRRWR